MSEKDRDPSRTRPGAGRRRRKSADTGPRRSRPARPPQAPPETPGRRAGDGPDPAPAGPAAMSHWLQRRAELELFEQVCGAVRRTDGARHWHEWAGAEFPADLPAGRDADDPWAWAAGHTGPRYSEDLHEMAVVEAMLAARGLAEPYGRALLDLLGLDPADPDVALTPAAAFALATAPPLVRLMAASCAWGDARRDGLA